MKSTSNDDLTSPYNLDIDDLRRAAARLRKNVFEICLAAANGHVGGSSGAVELMAALYFGGVLRFNPDDPADSRRDRVLVRGHLGPVRYPIFAELGFIERDELLTYRRFGSRLQGHEDHTVMPGVDITPSGSLGMLLSYGVGAAVAARHTGATYRTFVFLGDGEEQEGNVSEAARHAARLRLGNLVAIIDANGKQLSNPVEEGAGADVGAIWRGYGWRVIDLPDGNDVVAARDAYLNAIEQLSDGGPVLIVAHTVKGKGLEGAADHFSGYHTMSVCPKGLVGRELASLGDVPSPGGVVRRPRLGSLSGFRASPFNPVTLDLKPAALEGSLGEWQSRYLEELRNRGLLGDRPTFFLTADTTRKDFVDQLCLQEFTAYDNVGLREQHLFAYAHGLSLSMPSSRILLNTFDAFLYRGFDQLAAMAHGGGSAVVFGDFAGLTNGRNGSTHQSSSQPVSLAALRNVTFLEPWDSLDLYRCLNWAIGQSRGVVYLRLHAAPVLPHHREDVGTERGFSRVWSSGEPPDLTLVSSGATTGSCVQAAERLAKEGVSVDVVSVVNHASVAASFAAELPAGKPVLTVYNGAASFLRRAVSDAVMSSDSPRPSRVSGLGFEVGTTGSADELFRHFGLDAEGVAAAARGLV